VLLLQGLVFFHPNLGMLSTRFYMIHGGSIFSYGFHPNHKSATKQVTSYFDISSFVLIMATKSLPPHASQARSLFKPLIPLKAMHLRIFLAFLWLGVLNG